MVTNYALAKDKALYKQRSWLRGAADDSKTVWLQTTQTQRIKSPGPSQ